jgi:thiamine biosynthesis lipoprotein
MASPLRLTIASAAGRDEPVDAAWAEVQATFARADAAMSRFREDSELTRLNRRAPAAMPISRDLAKALAAADRARRVTGGRFEPRVVEALERIGYLGVPQGHPAPAWAPIRPTRILDRAGRAGPVSVGSPVDLGGIGKGLALRWAATALDRWLATAPGPALGYLVDAGGDIVASGTPDGTAPWLVAIEDPAGGSEPVAVVAIRERGAIATSSIRRLRWEHAGRTVHHLIDPRTGEPGGQGLLAVTVAGPDPAWPEVWSKALFLEGPGRIATVARARGLAAWWQTSEGVLEMTPGARVRTAWVADEA